VTSPTISKKGNGKKAVIVNTLLKLLEQLTEIQNDDPETIK
jgi:hypothetical protein